MISDIEGRLKGTLFGHIAQEYFTNSVHFPLVNLFLEMFLEGPMHYFAKADFYALFVGSLTQAYFLGSWRFNGRPRPLLGNLIGPVFYTAIESIIEGAKFFAEPNHLAYWGFSLVLGLVQEIRLYLSGRLEQTLMLFESLVRTAILLVMYWIFESLTHPTQYASLEGFLSDDSHVFFTLVILFLGLTVGFANITAGSYLAILRQTASQLRIYSEWLLGRHLLSRAITDPLALSLQRRNRTVLFMDIRGFTRWSELQPPEQVVAMLNMYFEKAEQVWTKVNVIKAKLTGDEVMIIFPSEQMAAQSALALCHEIGGMLSVHQLTAGIGIHSGPLVEGLIGSKDVKGYDVIGDTVNTAKRICDAATGGDIVISESVYTALGKCAITSEMPPITVKGKDKPIKVYSLLHIMTDETQGASVI